MIAAFRDVTSAQQDLQRLGNEADAYANRVVPEARGGAARILQEAEGYREQTVAEARGQASRFDQIYEQYKRAPELTRRRLYIETMERVLGGADKVILDESQGGGVAPYRAPAGLCAIPGGRPQVKNSLLFLAAFVLLAALAVAGGVLFTVGQTEQAIVLRFGEPVAGRGLITTPGLNFKIPLIENVIFLDNRILAAESPNLEVLASDNQRLEVDSFVRYKHRRSLALLPDRGRRAGREQSARLGAELRGAPRVERSQPAADRARRPRLAHGQDQGAGERRGAQIRRRRSWTRASGASISRSRFPRRSTGACKPSAPARPRNIARRARSRRRGSPPRPTATSSVLKAEAQRQADQTKGEGDAERNRIFAEAFGKDPDFFAFYRSMQAYESAFKPGDTRFLIGPRSEFFRFFGTPEGSDPRRADEPAQPANTNTKALIRKRRFE